jgi:2-oxo-3-hexenedioate decarboxylase
MRSDADVEQLAVSLLAAWDESRQIEPLASAPGGLTLEEAYRAADAIRRLREARGERVAGRKIGFTNRTIWDEYNVRAPIWGYMYNSTVRELSGEAAQPYRLNRAFEPRIEPEIAFYLGRTPHPEMDDRELLDCIDWVVHGFEIVHSLFPGWKFSPADTVAGFGLHGAFYIGPRHEPGADREQWLAELPAFEIELSRGGSVMEKGYGRNVLGGPLQALRHLIAFLSARENPPLKAPEIVATGTLTRALPVASGETWSTKIKGLPLCGIEISFA